MILVLQKYKMNFDKNTGVIEMIMESLTPADEGTFTFQLQDGKATNQSSLVLIGDGMFSHIKRSWSKKGAFNNTAWEVKIFWEINGYSLFGKICKISTVDSSSIKY